MSHDRQAAIDAMLTDAREATRAAVRAEADRMLAEVRAIAPSQGRACGIVERAAQMDREERKAAHVERARANYMPASRAAPRYAIPTGWDESMSG